MIILNTVGGDVDAGHCIAEMIAGMSKSTVSIVLGGGHSIGVPIAVSSDWSFIADSNVFNSGIAYPYYSNLSLLFLLLLV